MSGTVISGNSGNVTTPIASTIVSAVAGSGITTCTTSAPHLFGATDNIEITGATGMTGLNAAWQITVTGATTFTVPSALSGSYGASSATATDYSLTPQFQWPIDGDSFSAQLSALISGATMQASWSQWLAAQVRALVLKTAPSNLVLVASGEAAVSAGSGWGNTTVLVESTLASPGAVTQLTISGTIVGDVIEVEAAPCMLYAGSNNPGTCWLNLEYSETPSGGTTVPFADSLQTSNPRNTTGTPQYTIPLLGRHVVGNNVGSFAVCLNGYVFASGAQSNWIPAGGNLKWRQWRPVT